MKKNILFFGLFLCMLLSGCRRDDTGKENQPDQVTPPVEDSAQVQIPNPEEMIVDPAAWKEQYPLIYESFLKTSTMGDDKVESSDLGGSHPIDYLKKYPNIAILYEGMGFAKEYYQARGHHYALEDVINISRPKPGASCLACKSAEYEKLVIQNGDTLFSMDFQTTVQDVEFGISCYNCHRNTPGEGIQTPSPHFNAAVNMLETDLKPGTEACAQCHVEYYLDPNSKAVILPWDNGIEVDQIEAYYDERGFSDWTHPRTGTPLLKVQHPEFEMYSGSVHAKMNISCADCHMPTMTENGEQYKSHWAKSPLKTTAESCGKCHSVEGLIDWVQTGQLEIEQLEAEVSDMLVKLTIDFAKAIEEKKLDDTTITTLRDLNRKAQYRWDFVFVENSTGFHNFDKAKNTLSDAKSYAQEALNILDGLE